MKKQRTRRLAAIMFTDIVGYSALMQQNEKAAVAMRERHRRVFRQCHEKYHGEIVQYFGDGTLSVFQSGVEAVECAIALQRTLQQADDSGQPVPLRIGLHMGDIVFDGTDIFGDGVNLASRIESLGVEGAVLLSRKLNDELKNQAHILTLSMGAFTLKNIEEPVEVFAVASEGIKVPDRSEIKGKRQEPSKAIAVLPFVNMSADPDNEYFSDGMTEEIINALAKIKGLKVTSRTSSFFFKNKKIPLAQIGRELNVSNVLQGSIRLSGRKMRITAQLVDVVEDFHFWSETFDRSIDDIFAVQDEVSLLIADKLREHVGHFEIGEQLVDAPDVPVEVYKKYLQSRYHLLKMGKSDIEKGLSILEEILRQQPDFALAHLAVHLGYTLLGTIGLLPALEAFAKGQPHLDRAIALKPDMPESQLHLAYASFLQDWDLPAAYRHLNKSLEIRPSVDYYQSMASVLVAEGKFEAALNYIETAIQLDPFSEINYHLKGFIYYCQRMYEQAVVCFEKAIELKPDFIVSNLYQGQTLLLMGRLEEALTFFQKLPADESNDVMKLGGMTLSYAAMGDTARAEAGVKKLQEALETDLMGRAMNLLILCLAMLNKQEEAMVLVEKGVEMRLPMMVYLYFEPIVRPLRSLPRFQASMRKVLGAGTDFGLPKRKYKKALFSKADLKKHKVQLQQLMKDEKPYLNPDLSLRSLAEMMDLPPNHLSQLLNEGFDKNFSEYVNTFRLDTFKAKAANPALQHLTILALAYESGFNSKTVFNTFFKKMMGKTPKAYWKEVVQS